MAESARLAPQGMYLVGSWGDQRRAEGGTAEEIADEVLGNLGLEVV